MNKRHKIIALLAAAAGIGVAGTTEAAVTSRIDFVAEVGSTWQEGVATRSDEELSRMIQLAAAKGFDRSKNPVAGPRKPDKNKPKGNDKPKDNKKPKKDRDKKNPS